MLFGTRFPRRRLGRLRRLSGPAPWVLWRYRAVNGHANQARNWGAGCPRDEVPAEDSSAPFAASQGGHGTRYRRQPAAVQGPVLRTDFDVAVSSGDAKFGPWNTINDMSSSGVCLVRGTIAGTVMQVNEPTDGDRSVGVIRDEIVELGRKSRSCTRPDHPTRQRG